MKLSTESLQKQLLFPEFPFTQLMEILVQGNPAVPDTNILQLGLLAGALAALQAENMGLGLKV